MFYLTTINNNVTNATINFASNKLIYEFRINDSLKLLKNLLTKNYNRFRLIKQELIEKAIIFVNIVKKLRYDVVYINLKLVIDNYVYLCFYNNYTISNLINKKLNQQ